MSAATTPNASGLDLKAAHNAAYLLAQHAHADGCQIPPEIVYQSAFLGLVLTASNESMASEIAEPLHRAAFAVVGTLSALRDVCQPKECAT